MEQIIKLCGVALLCAAAGLILKQFRADFSLLLRIGGTVILFSVASLFLGDIMTELQAVTEPYGFLAYSSVLLKALGISIISKVSSDICRDLGEGTIAGGVELCGKLSILALCIPLIGELVGYAAEILKLQ